MMKTPDTGRQVIIRKTIPGDSGVNTVGVGDLNIVDEQVKKILFLIFKL